MLGTISMARALSCVAAALLLTTCGDDEPTGPDLEGGGIYAVTFSNRLVRFGSEDPATLLDDAAISGLPSGARIVAIDFRPSDGRLYGVGTDNRVYVINPETAVATPVGPAFSAALDGDHFGLAVNPVVDRIRTASVESEQNLRLNPADGTLTATDVGFTFAPGDPNAGDNPAVAALAYTNSVSGATSTTLYGIDSNNDVLVTLANPNDGVLTTVGPLGVNTVPCTGFDIDPADGEGYVALSDNGVSRLYVINLSTGAATLIGVISVSSEVQALAVAP